MLEKYLFVAYAFFSGRHSQRGDHRVVITMGSNPCHHRLLSWYRTNQRRLPWRLDADPYKIWISEIMLQQTQVRTAIPYFERFIERFPTVDHLAAASIDELLRYWQGLGYYSRVRLLHKAARSIITEHGGELPRSYQALLNLPGIGAYTAGAVSSIAFGEAVPAIDGNVLRVFSRFFAIADSDRRQLSKRIESKILPLLKTVDPSQFNQAVMELGALICRPRRPDCKCCPWQGDCLAYRNGQTEELPKKRRKGPIPHYDIAVGIVRSGSRLLMQRRPEKGFLGGLWQFPGARRQNRESLGKIVEGIFQQEWKWNLEFGRRKHTIRHAYSHFRISLHAFSSQSTEASPPIADETDPWQWLPIASIGADYPIDRATQKLLELVHEPDRVDADR